MKIIIDSKCRINYASYYIKGFCDLFEKKNVVYDSTPFDSNNLLTTPNDYANYLLIQYHNNSIVKNIIIDFGDSSSISIKHYEWCDVYGKINVLKNDLVQHPKMIAIGPSFGINYMNLSTLRLLFISLFKKNKPVNNKEYIKNFLYMKVRRMSYKSYLGSNPNNKYIFAISTLWYDPLTFKTTNYFRIVFFSFCKKILEEVEGGFFYIEGKGVTEQFPEYSSYKNEIKNNLFKRRITPSEYVKKTKKSIIVFNTPSVMSCHGWKLGEYFAMGKAILSTPLANEMPQKLLDNNTICFADSKEMIENKVQELIYNEKIRSQMELNTSEYFEKYLSPTAVINRIINHTINQ
jgi:glycosyltransferase involved in cell wall biosynthesis